MKIIDEAQRVGDDYGIRPIRDEVLIQRDPPQTMSASGLIALPESSQAWRGTLATVIAAGPKCTEVKAGDRVHVGLYGGVEYRHRGVLVALIKESEIYALDLAHA